LDANANLESGFSQTVGYTEFTVEHENYDKEIEETLKNLTFEERMDIAVPKMKMLSHFAA
jgi:hypothetical protein